MDDSPAMSEITPDELYERIQRGCSPCVLDVRNAEEFAAWTIEGLPPASLLNIPYFTFLEDEVNCLRRLPRDREVAVVCAKGGSSAFIASMLAEHGIQARNLQGGMIAWGDLHRATSLTSASHTGVRLFQINRVGKRCLSYVIISDGEALVIDPARYLDWYTTLIQEQHARLTGVLDTHLHADHLSGGPGMARAFGVPYYIRLDDAAGAQFPYTSLVDGAHLSFGASVVEIMAMHTPGHTPGSTSLLVNGAYLLTGDTLFVSSIGRPDLGDKAEEWAQFLYHTLFDRMASLPPEVRILPAHYSGLHEVNGDGTVATTLGEARHNNPVFQSRTEAEFLHYVLGHLPPQPAVYQDIRRANLGRIVLDEEQALAAELGPNQCAATLQPSR